MWLKASRKSWLRISRKRRVKLMETDNNTLNEYLENRRKDLNRLKQNSINENLIEWGLVKREYKPPSSDKFGSKGYPFYDSKEKNYYKQVAIEVTDEEYEEICRLNREELDLLNDANTKPALKMPIITLLKVAAGIIFFGGFILGWIFGIETVYVWGGAETTQFSIGIAIGYWVFAFIFGVLTLGIAEIIKLLNEINIKTDRK